MRSIVSLKCTLMDTESHTDERKFVTCNLCFNLLFKLRGYEGSLNFHIRIHRKIKPHQCRKCTLSYRTPGNLKPLLELVWEKMKAECNLTVVGNLR